MFIFSKIFVSHIFLGKFGLKIVSSPNWLKSGAGGPHEKVNLCLTNINWYLSGTENEFYKVSLTSVNYRFTQISALVIFNRYLTNTNWNILETNIIGKIG